MNLELLGNWIFLILGLSGVITIMMKKYFAGAGLLLGAVCIPVHLVSHGWWAIAIDVFVIGLGLYFDYKKVTLKAITNSRYFSCLIGVAAILWGGSHFLSGIIKGNVFDIIIGSIVLLIGLLGISLRALIIWKRHKKEKED